MRIIARILLAGVLAFGGFAFLMPDDADARGGFRSSARSYSSRPRVKTGFRKSRTKTYTLGNKKIDGYRNYVKARREAKLASGGYKLRKDGKVVQRTWTVRTGTVRTGTVRTGTVQTGRVGTGVTTVSQPVLGQCRDGSYVTKGDVEFACRNFGGVSWTGQSRRITGVRDY